MPREDLETQLQCGFRLKKLDSPSVRFPVTLGPGKDVACGAEKPLSRQSDPKLCPCLAGWFLHPGDRDRGADVPDKPVAGLTVPTSLLVSN